MLLAIDTGNTNTLFAIHDGKEQMSMRFGFINLWICKD